MSLEIYPTFPKIRADQLNLVDWTQVDPLMNLINTGDANTLSAALALSNLDPAVANAIGTANSASRNAVRNAIDAPFLDPLVANNVNTPSSQTRTAIQSLLSTNAMLFQGTFAGGSANWDAYTTPGIYRVNTVGSGGVNVPPIFPATGILIVTNHSGIIGQYVFTDDGQRAARYYSGTWSAWYAHLNRRVVRFLVTDVALNTTEATIVSIPLTPTFLGLWGGGSNSLLFIHIVAAGAILGGTTQIGYLALKFGTSRLTYVSSYIPGTGSDIAMSLATAISASLDGTALSLVGWVSTGTATARAASQSTSPTFLILTL